MPEQRIHFFVRGVVQGVGFRRTLCREAERLGLRGWVRNRADGAVEAWAVGPAAAIECLLAWARRGPPAARVTALEIADGVLEPDVAEGFEQRPSL